MEEAARPPDGGPRDGGGCFALPFMRPLDLGRPGRYEAIVITYISLASCTFFWLLGIMDVIQDPGVSVIATALESMFDVISTFAVIWRLRYEDALDDTPANNLIEARTSVVLSFFMIAIATVLIGFSTYNVIKNDPTVNRSGLKEAVTLSFPSAIVYLVIGMIQISLGCVMRVRSLRQDGVISILAAVVSLGALLAALINLITCEYQEFIDVPNGNANSSAIASTPPVPIATQIRDHASWIRYGKADTKIFLEHRILYPYYWCEDLITITLAVCILFLGMQSLISDAQEGVKWWTREFWSRPLPDDPRAAVQGAERGAGGPKESTPLSSKPTGEQEPSYHTAGSPL